MTPKKFLLISFLQWLFLAMLKVWIFKGNIFANQGVEEVLFWFLTIVIVSALVRRFTAITFLEAFFLTVVWTLLDLLLDLIFVSPYAGLSIFSTIAYWAGLGVMDLSIMLFHRKRHIHIREQQHAHH